jgi:hypothetical protein
MSTECRKISGPRSVIKTQEFHMAVSLPCILYLPLTGLDRRHKMSRHHRILKKSGR